MKGHPVTLPSQSPSPGKRPSRSKRRQSIPGSKISVYLSIDINNHKFRRSSLPGAPPFCNMTFLNDSVFYAGVLIQSGEDLPLFRLLFHHLADGISGVFDFLLIRPHDVKFGSGHGEGFQIIIGAGDGLAVDGPSFRIVQLPGDDL